MASARSQSQNVTGLDLQSRPPKPELSTKVFFIRILMAHLWNMSFHSPHFRQGQLVKPVRICLRIVTSKLRWGPCQSTPLSEAPVPNPRVTPSSCQHGECLSQLQIISVLKWWWQEPGKYTERGMVAKRIPRSGTSLRENREKVNVVSAQGAVFPHSVQSSGIPESTEKWRGRTLSFSIFDSFIQGLMRISSHWSLQIKSQCPGRGAPGSWGIQQYPYWQEVYRREVPRSVPRVLQVNCTLLSFSQTTWLEITRSVGKERDWKRNGREVSQAGGHRPLWQRSLPKCDREITEGTWLDSFLFELLLQTEEPQKQQDQK